MHLPHDGLHSVLTFNRALRIHRAEGCARQPRNLPRGEAAQVGAADEKNPAAACHPQAIFVVGHDPRQFVVIETVIHGKVIRSISVDQSQSASASPHPEEIVAIAIKSIDDAWARVAII
jgi:hypothetical protein